MIQCRHDFIACMQHGLSLTVNQKLCKAVANHTINHSSGDWVLLAADWCVHSTGVGRSDSLSVIRANCKGHQFLFIQSNRIVFVCVHHSDSASIKI
jgi:hypothetical protein